MGQNEALIKLVDEAKHDVCLFFENAFKGLGQNKYEKVEDLAHEATAIFIEKVAKGSGGCEPEEKGSRAVEQGLDELKNRAVVVEETETKYDARSKGKRSRDTLDLACCLKLLTDEDGLDGRTSVVTGRIWDYFVFGLGSIEHHFRANGFGRADGAELGLAVMNDGLEVVNGLMEEDHFKAHSERLRPTGGVFDTATQNHHSNLHNGVQVGVNSTRITSELGTQQQSRGYLQSSDQVNATFGSQNILNYSTVNASVVPFANFDSATVHSLNAFNNANVVGSVTQQSTGLTSGTTAPIFGTLSSNLAGQGGTLPTASASVAAGNANYVASPLIANNATNLISSVHGPSVSDLNANNLINNLANVEINNLATVSNFETLPAAHNETSKFVHGINSLNYGPGANVLHNAILGNSNLAPVVNSLNNAYVNNTLPTVSTNADNPSALHGLNSLNNANVSSALPTALFGNTNLVPVSVNLPTGNINNSNAALGSTTLPTVHNATTIDKNLSSFANASIDKNMPSVSNAKSGGGTAFTTARHNHTSKNPNNSRVNFQPSVQPSGGGVSQPPNVQNQAQEGTGLTKSQKRTLAKKRRREKGKDPIIDVGLGTFSVPQVAIGVGTSTNPMLGLSHSQPVAPIPISTCNTFTLLQDVNETVLAEGAHIQEDVHDTTLATQAHTQEAATKDFDAELDDHLAKVLDQEGVPQSQEEPQVQSQNDTQTPVIAHNPTRANNEDAYSSPTQVEDSSTQGDACSAAPISMGLHTPVREQGTGLCPLNTEQATIPTVSPVAHNTKAPVTKRTRRTRSASEQSNVAGFYREASDDDDDSDSSVAGRVAIFESAGRNREFVGGHGSPPKTSKVPFGGRITRSQVRPEQSSAAVGTPISSQSPSLDSFRLRLGFDSAFAGVDDKLWLFWNSDLTLSFESDSEQSVSVSCIHATIPTVFWVSFVYAKTKEHLRVSLWAELCSVSDKVMCMSISECQEAILLDSHLKTIVSKVLLRKRGRQLAVRNVWLLEWSQEWRVRGVTRRLSRAVEPGIDELVRRISVEQFVGEAVLEAATNMY
nr:uncharacterized protein LOC109150827 [Ipomoea batatas]